MAHVFPMALSALVLAAGPWTAYSPPVARPVKETPIGMWSRVVGQGFMREVIELRPNGAYTSGLCGVISMGWCTKGEATASLPGTYVVRGDTFITDRGFVNLESRHRAGVAANKAYRWRVEWDPPDNPPSPTSRPPLRRLYVQVAADDEIMFSEMPATYRPRWVKRADR